MARTTEREKVLRYIERAPRRVADMVSIAWGNVAASLAATRGTLEHLGSYSAETRVR